MTHYYCYTKLCPNIHYYFSLKCPIRQNRLIYSVIFTIFVYFHHGKTDTPLLTHDQNNFSHYFLSNHSNIQPFLVIFIHQWHKSIISQGLFNFFKRHLLLYVSIQYFIDPFFRRDYFIWLFTKFVDKKADSLSQPFPNSLYFPIHHILSYLSFRISLLQILFLHQIQISPLTH